MPSEEEVLRYKMDIGDAERKSQRLQQLLEEIKAKRGRGEDVSKLEAEFHKEAEGLAKVAQEHKKVADATQKTTAAQSQFNDSAKTALTGVLGRLSPELASLANVAVDVAKGIGQASTALLGMLGAGAALGGLVMFFRHLASAAEKAELAIRRAIQARREAARESIAVQKEVADALEDAGILGVAGAGRATAERLMAGGMERQLAVFGAVAQQVGRLAREQVEPVIGAWLLGGRQGAFGLDPAANQKLIQQLLTVDREQAVAALRARMHDVALAQVPPVPSSDVARQRAAAAARLKQKDLTEREREVGMRLLSGEDPIEFRGWLDWFWRGEAPDVPAGLSRAQASTYQGARRRFIMERAPTGDATRTMAELLDMAGAAQRDVQQEAPTTQRITINIINDGQINASHVQMGPDRRPPKNPMSRMGPSRHDIKRPP